MYARLLRSTLSPIRSKAKGAHLRHRSTRQRSLWACARSRRERRRPPHARSLRSTTRSRIQTCSRARSADISARIAASCAIELEQPPSDPSQVNLVLNGHVIPQEGANGWTISGSFVTVLGASCDEVHSIGPQSDRHGWMPDRADSAGQRDPLKRNEKRSEREQDALRRVFRTAHVSRFSSPR